jgi:ABC-2 type transport system permease protein
VIAVELSKLMRSRRTWITIALVDALPTLVAVLLSTTDLAPRPGTGPAFLSAVLDDGKLFPLAAVAIVLPLFLPVAVAMTAGEAIAGEAQAGTLRYLLIRPVGRTRLLVAKLVSVMVFVVVTVLVVAATAYVSGALLLGDASSTGGTGVTVSVSGSSLSTAELAWRTALALLYAMLAMLGVASIALFLSTIARSPLAAALGTLAVLAASTLLLPLDAAHALRPYLLTRYWLSFVDLFRDPIQLTNVVHGVIQQASYVVVLLAAAWANFTTRDITD